MDVNSTIQTAADAPSTSHSKPKSPASCTLCRHRKIKCDRSIPCGHCKRSGAECVPFIPSRAPRGRQGGRKRKRGDDELLERIAKLENLVKNIEGHESPQDDTNAVGSKIAPGAVTFTTKDESPLDESPNDEHLLVAPRNPPRTPAMSQYLASSFWVNLSEEINGLKDVLGDSLGDDSEDEGEHTPSSASQQSAPNPQQAFSHSGFVLSQPMVAVDAVHPTHHQVYTLCDRYLTNFDPVLKVLHGPSLRRFLQEHAPQLECSPGPGGIEALKFAVYYAAVTSMTEAECRNRTGEEKGSLLAKFRSGIESGLAKADFVNTVEMSTLQALAIYLVAVRANDTSRLMWTLTSLAIRIAEAMGLHHESTLSSLRPFDREMRRRLWWQLCDLDSHASDDRASNPIIVANSFDTRLPLHINDHDIGPNTLEDPTEVEGFTDMTFTLCCNDMFDAIRTLNYVPARELDRQQNDPQEAWSRRIDTVVQFQRSTEQKYLRHLNLSRPFHWFTRQVADVITAIMWLVVYRPLQRLPDSITAIRIADPGILGLSVDVLERAQQLLTDPAADPFKWISQTYVQWHALAVTAAELCVKTEGPMVEKAWAIIEPTFTQTAQHVADSHKGMLWRPIKKLMVRARGIREQYLRSQSTSTDPSDKGRSSDANNQMQVLNLTGKPPLGLNGSLQQQLGGLDFPLQNVPQPPPTNTSAPFDWDPWLTAATAATATAIPNQFDNYKTDMTWTNWEDFISDFQGQGDVMPGPSNVANAFSNAWP